MAAQPYIIGIGGTTRPGSTTETALAHTLAAAGLLGARTDLFAGADIMLPIYDPQEAGRDPRARALVEAMRRADGIVIASPGYHGSISGLIKNAIDYAEDLARDERPYFDGRAIGMIVCAAGWQATGSTMTALRSIAHALRGWPTPLGVAINTVGPAFTAEGVPVDPAVGGQLSLLARQVTGFALAQPAQEPVASS